MLMNHEYFNKLPYKNINQTFFNTNIIPNLTTSHFVQNVIHFISNK